MQTYAIAYEIDPHKSTILIVQSVKIITMRGMYLSICARTGMSTVSTPSTFSAIHTPQAGLGSEQSWAALQRATSKNGRILWATKSLNGPLITNATARLVDSPAKHLEVSLCEYGSLADYEQALAWATILIQGADTLRSVIFDLRILIWHIGCVDDE